MADESLTSFIQDVLGDSRFRVEDDLGSGFVRLKTTEAERRQAKQDIRCTEDIVIELLRNSRDAQARTIFLAVSKSDTTRRLCIIDDGSGIPEAFHAAVFEPRVTSKLDTMHMDHWGVHGRGMALFSIASNATTACIAQSGEGLGTSILVETKLSDLPEKTDQSTMPTVSFAENGALLMRGPHNIVRTACEFAISANNELQVYCGSPVEIAATLYAYGMATTPLYLRAGACDIEQIPLIKRLCYASDAEEFASIALSIGLPISERSARRIMDGSIEALDTLIDMLGIIPSVTHASATTGEQASSKKSPRSDTRGLRIADCDIEDFSSQVQEAFADLAARYYLDANIEPTIRISKDSFKISFPIIKLH